MMSSLALNERISVKTITSSTHVAFNSTTFEFVDRVIVLRVNVDQDNGISVEEIFDEPAEKAKAEMRSSGSNYTYVIPRASQREQRPIEELRVTARASYSDFEIVRYESGAIRIVREGVVSPSSSKMFSSLSRLNSGSKYSILKAR